MTIRTRLERLEAKSDGGSHLNLPTIIFTIVSREDDGALTSRPEIAKVPTAAGWVELTRNQDEATDTFLGRVKQCEVEVIRACSTQSFRR
jgi:hypothetical protein